MTSSGAAIYQSARVNYSEIINNILKMYNAKLIGSIDGINESYYAISAERKLKHPSVVEITKYARDKIFKNS